MTPNPKYFFFLKTKRRNFLWTLFSEDLSRRSERRKAFCPVTKEYQIPLCHDVYIPFWALKKYLKFSCSRLIFLPIRFLENNTPVNIHIWRQLILNLTLIIELSFSWSPFGSPSLSIPGKLYSSSTLCHMSPCSVNCSNHVTCESDPRGDKCGVSHLFIGPIKNQTLKFYPIKQCFRMF